MRVAPILGHTCTKNVTEQGWLQVGYEGIPGKGAGPAAAAVSGCRVKRAQNVMRSTKRILCERRSETEYRNTGATTGL